MTTIGWDDINAYVDRELDAAACARIAAAIAGDPSLAARVASLSRLKAMTTAIQPPHDAPPIPQGGTLGTAARRPLWQPLAIAASIALLIAAGSATWLGRGSSVDPVATAASIERVWLSGTTVDAPETQGAQLRLALANGLDERLPELSGADLRLVYLALDPADADRGAFAGYVGPRGCRVGLWLGRGDGTEYPPNQRDLGPTKIRVWSDGARAFAVMSQGMDGDRLSRVASLVADLMRNEPRFDEQHRTGLAVAARSSVPCLG